MDNYKEISIITVNYNGFNDTCNFIESCYNHIKEYIYEIIVIDNGSKVDESIPLKEKYPDIIAIRCNKNLGFAGANNIGIRKANGKYLFFLNNDVIVFNNKIHELLVLLNSSINIAGISPLILNEDKLFTIQWAGYTKLSTLTLRNKSIGKNQINNHQYISSPTPFLHGAAMLIKKECIDKVGYMDEDYFLYYEELDWCEKFIKKGFKLWFCPSFQIIHKNSGSIGMNSPLKTYYLTRNRLLFAFKNRNKIDLFFLTLYFIILVTPKNIIKSILNKKYELSKAYYLGLKDYFKYRNHKQ